MAEETLRVLPDPFDREQVRSGPLRMGFTGMSSRAGWAAAHGAFAGTVAWHIEHSLASMRKPVYRIVDAGRRLPRDAWRRCARSGSCTTSRLGRWRSLCPQAPSQPDWQRQLGADLHS
jgi:hypothetical protein